MTPQLLLPLLLLPAVLVAVPAAAGGCQHLLVDPAGDATRLADAPYPRSADDPSQVDLLWAQLSTTRTRLDVTINLRDLAPEDHTTLSHAYSVNVTTGGQTCELIAHIDTDGTTSAAAEGSLSGSPHGDGSEAPHTLGAIASREGRHDLVHLSAPRSLLGGVTGSISHIGEMGWTKATVSPCQRRAHQGVEEGRTDRTYRPIATAGLTSVTPAA